MVSTRFLAGGSRAPVLLMILAFAATLASAYSSRFESAGALIPRARRDPNNTLALDRCLTKAGIEISRPGSGNWTQEIETWNFRVNPKPSFVAFPDSEKQVSEAVKCAASTGTKVTTLGGQRSFSSMGFGRNDGALVLNMRKMLVLKYDPKTQLFTFGGPATISQGARTVWKGAGRLIVHGRCPDVGLFGLIAAGFGTLSRVFGTFQDNVVGLRIALANGTIVDANATHNSEIFWASKGALSSIGVGITATVKTFAPPADRVVNYTIAFPSDYKPTQQDNVNALVGAQAWSLSPDNDDYLSIRFFLRASSTLVGFFYPKDRDFKTVSESLMKHLPSNMVLTTNESDIWQSEEYTTPGLQTGDVTPRRPFYIASVTTPASGPLDNSTAWSLFNNTVYVPKYPGVSASGFCDLWAGAYTKTIKPSDSAWVHTDVGALVRWDIRPTATDPTKVFTQDVVNSVHEKFYKFVADYEAKGYKVGGFTTYRDELWTIDEVAKYLFPGNWERLRRIKTIVDPNEVFNSDPQSIPAYKK